MGEAAVVTIGELLELVRGTTYKSALLGDQGPVLLGLGTIERDGGFRADKLKRYSGESKDRLLIPAGELYVSLKDVTQAGDLLGAVAMVPEFIGTGRLTQDTVHLKFKDKSFPKKYLYWLLRTPQYRDFCRSCGMGTTNLSLDRDDFLNYEIPVLDDVRQVLYGLLEDIEAKIDLLHRQNKTLEAMAEALFRQWFVEEVEQSWPWEQLGSHVEVLRGLSYTGAGLCEKGEGVPMHNLNSICNGGGYKYQGIKYYAGEYKDRHVVRGGDIIVANTDLTQNLLLIGCPAIVPMQVGQESVYSHHLYKLNILSPALTNLFVYQLLMSADVRDQITGATNGSTVNMLPKDGIEMATFQMPPKGKIERFNAIASPLHQKQEKNYIQIQTLIAQRDTLLPKLMSGEVRVEMNDHFTRSTK